jgi:hypothetical protein
MTSPKRPRGRPRGTGKNDTQALMKVADILAREPALPPTTAMRRVISAGNDWKESDPTLVRRWQEKWKQQGVSLLAAAQERARPKPAPALSFAPQPSFSQMAAIVATLNHMPKIDMAMVRAATAHAATMKSIMESPVIKKWAALNRLTDPALRIMAEHNRVGDTLAPTLRFSEEHRRALAAIGGQQHIWRELARHPHVLDSISRIFPR